jgi:putative phosphoesterase
MRIGIFADSHDHLANLRLAVDRFNREGVDLVLFAGDLVSTIAVPPLRRLESPLIACFGDNEGNKVGLLSGFASVGRLLEPPLLHTTDDGTRIAVAHMKRQLRGLSDEFDVAVFAHTHKPRIERDDWGRLFINPGETGGWSFGRPTIALLDTRAGEAEIIDLAPGARQGSPTTAPTSS